MIIDAYSHVFPSDLVDAVLEANPSSDIAGLLAQTPHMYDVELRLAYLDQQQIDQQLVTLAYPHILEEWLRLPVPRLHQITRVANDAIAHLVARQPDRLLGVGILPAVDEELLGELERMHVEGLKGVMISSNIGGEPLDAAKMWPLYERAVALGMPIWIHPQNAIYYPWLSPREPLFMVLGWPFETTLAMARMVIGGVFRRYPTLKVIVHHAGGGMIPFFFERIKCYFSSDSASIALPEEAQQPVDPEDFKKFYADTVVSGSLAALRCSLALFGPDHMLFGTDFPFGPQGGEAWLPRVLQSVRELDISDLDREKLLFRNAQRVLAL